MLCGADGLIEANLSGPGIRAQPPLVCRADDEVLFRLEVYEPAPRSLVALAHDGAALGTYLRRGSLLSEVIDVRDETSAPVARFEPVAHGVGFRLVETSGRVLAVADRLEVEDRDFVDDQWSLTPVTTDLPLDPLAVVALVVAAKVLLGRPEPVAMREAKEASDERDDGLLGPIGRGIIDGLFS